MFLVGTPVFNTGERRQPSLAGSIPVRLRCRSTHVPRSEACAARRAGKKPVKARRSSRAARYAWGSRGLPRAPAVPRPSRASETSQAPCGRGGTTRRSAASAWAARKRSRPTASSSSGRRWTYTRSVTATEACPSQRLITAKGDPGLEPERRAGVTQIVESHAGPGGVGEPCSLERRIEVSATDVVRVEGLVGVEAVPVPVPVPVLAVAEQLRVRVTGVRVAGEESCELAKEDLVQHGHLTNRPLGLRGPDDPPTLLSVPADGSPRRQQVRAGRCPSQTGRDNATILIPAVPDGAATSESRYCRR